MSNSKTNCVTVFLRLFAVFSNLCWFSPPLLWIIDSLLYNKTSDLTAVLTLSELYKGASQCIFEKSNLV